MESAMSLAVSPHRVHRPRQAAIRTVLRWNLVPLVLVVACVLFAWTHTAVYGGGALAISAGLGIAFTAALVRPAPPRTDGTYGHTVTGRSAFRRGSLAALLGWLTMVVGVVVAVTVNLALTDAGVIWR
jgi:hypothetical protein